jgi:xanthine/uracil/vitamin C permease (AzgA family)
VSRSDLQWMVVLNAVVISLFAVVFAIDVDGSVIWGLLVVAAMAWQIRSATRPERPAEAATDDTPVQS